MPSIAGSDDAVQQIKSRLNLLEVVQNHVRVRKQGREFVGLCPFHQEKTPSFSVNEQLQSWYCHGCGKGGDMFTFVENIEKTDFRGALDSLAELAGVELSKEVAGPGRERAAQRRRIVELNKLAVQYYEYVLHSTPAGEAGRQLLARREVGEDVARRFGLGFAPGGDNFASFLRKRGKSLEDARDAGLVRADGQDFFQQRLVVPIRDERGQPLAFTGRTVLADEPRKYVNSRETPVYVKGNVLFALDLARTEIAARGHAVLMEGQFDVIVGHQFGVANAIASSGTAMTEQQVRLLKRFTEEVVLVFDNDNAGRNAAFKAIEVAAADGLRTRVGTLEGEAKDPDEFLRGGGDWGRVVELSMPGWEFWIKDTVRDLNPSRPRDLEIALVKVNAVLGKIADPALRETYRGHAAVWLGIEPHLLQLKAAGAGRRPEPGSDPGLGPKRNGKKRVTTARYLLQVLAVRPDAAERVRARLKPEELEEDERGAYVRLLETLQRGGFEALGREVSEYPEEEQDLIRQAWHNPPPSVDDALVDELVTRVRQEAAKKRRLAIISGLAEAERRQDRERAAALEAELRELTHREEAEGWR